MKAQIEKLKQELREFIELSKAITPGKWLPDEEDGLVCFVSNDSELGFDVEPIAFVSLLPDLDDPGATYIAAQKEALSNATFIARSRNISPVVAACLLSVLEINERLAVWIAPCKAFPNGAPDNVAASTINSILTIWEASKK